MAHIIVTRHQLPFDTVSYEFEWVGKPTDTAFLQREYWYKYQKEIPWPLKIVDKEVGFVLDSYLVARTDGVNKLCWFYHYVRGKIISKSRKTWSRIILTLMVWDLAYVPPGEIPSLRHIGRARRRNETFRT